MTITREAGQPFVYQVASETDPTKFHCVNWLREECSCDAFAYGNRKWRETHPRNMVCKHLSATRELEWYTLIDTVKAEYDK